MKNSDYLRTDSELEHSYMIFPHEFEKKKNHVMLKLYFKHRITKGTPWAPRETTGVLFNTVPHGISSREATT